MAKNRQTPAAAVAQNRLALFMHLATIGGTVLNNAIRWGGLVAIAYLCYLSIESLAGKRTFADIGISLLGKLGVSQTLAWTLGAGGVGYGLQQRRLRRETIARLDAHIKELERLVDSQRSSSGLTPKGETHPKDEL